MGHHVPTPIEESNPLKNNPKVDFDVNNHIFSFKKKFHSLDDLAHRLFTDRTGVIEDEDLYDDVDKERLQHLKNGDFFREIVIKERKTKAPLILLYSKNHD